MKKRKNPAYGRGLPSIGPDNGARYQPSTIGGQAFTTKAVQTWRLQASRLVHPQVNGCWDPVTIALVLDFLMRIEHTSYFRARDFVNIMPLLYPQILWDTTTVGKILAEITDIAERSGAPHSPIDWGRDNEGRYYMFNKTIENWRWLGLLRNAMGAFAEKQIKEEFDTSAIIKRLGFPNEPIAHIRWGEGTFAA